MSINIFLVEVVSDMNVDFWDRPSVHVGPYAHCRLHLVVGRHPLSNFFCFFFGGWYKEWFHLLNVLEYLQSCIKYMILYIPFVQRNLINGQQGNWALMSNRVNKQLQQLTHPHIHLIIFNLLSLQKKCT